MPISPQDKAGYDMKVIVVVTITVTRQNLMIVPTVENHHLGKTITCDSQKKNKEFACPTCNKLFLKKSNMERHQITHQKVVVNCNQCKRTFLRKDHLEKHM